MPNSTLLKFNFLFGCILLFCFIFNNNAKAQNYTISRFDYEFCITPGTVSLPATGSFSITETSTGPNDGFSHNQSNESFTLTLSPGFAFNTLPLNASISATGEGEFTVHSFSFNNDTTLTVILSTAKQSGAKTQLNTLSFNNFEIIAKGTHTQGWLRRSGGTFKIDNTAAKPSTTEYFGVFTTATPWTYNANNSRVDQVSTDSVFQYTINNRILRVNINGSGTCGSNITALTFNTSGTDGTDLNSNISTAKVYYTGNSTTFSSSNFVGEVTLPSGEFTVSANQQLSNGDNYFWLTYDVPGSANTGAGNNRLDAQFVSFSLNNNSLPITGLTNSNPTGSRTIYPATFYYSLSNGNWNDNTSWTTSETSTLSCNCQPNGAGVAIVRHNITLNAARTVDAVEIRNGGILTSASGTTNHLTTAIINTLDNGYFSLGASLNLSGNLTLRGTGSSTLSNTNVITLGGVLDIGSGTTLNRSGNTLRIGGNIIVNGSLLQSTSLNIEATGGTTNIGGLGTIRAANFNISNTNKTIPNGSALTFNSNINLQGITLTNNGQVVINGNLNGTNTSSKWVNGNSSYLNYKGSTKMFNTSGSLDASQTGNTVEYSLNGDQIVILPINSNQYFNLTISGAGNKTQSDGVIRIAGSLLNYGASYIPGYNSVIFNGTTSQIVGGTSALNFYEVVIENSITLNYNISISNRISFTNGVINTGTNTVIITNTATNTVVGAGAGKYVNGNLRKSFSSSVLTRNFEVGSNGDYTPVTITFSTLSTAGSLTVRSNNGDHAQISSSCINHLRSVNKNWSILNTGSSTAGTYSATFTFVTGNTDSGANPGSFRVARYNAALSPVWATLTAGTSGTTSTQATGINTFGDFQVGEITTTASVTIASTPSNATICAGETISFAISAASGLGTNPTYQWERKQAGTSTWSGISGATSTTYSSNTLANGDSIRLIATPGSSNCGTATAATSNAIGIIISSTITWTGATDNNWSTASNWCGNAVPTSAYDVVIPAGSTYYPEVNSSATVRSITIDENASLSVNASNSLTLTGNFTNNGQFTSSTLGSIQFSGTTSQVVGGNGNTQFGAILISNAAGVTLNQSITVAGNLNLQTGSINLNNNLLTLGENATITNADAGKYIVAQGGGFVQAPVALNKTIVFPIGTSSAYSPMEFVLKRATLTGGEYIQANVDVASSQGHPQLDYNAVANPIYLKRFWRLISSNTGGIEAGKDFGYDVKFTYLDSDTINTANKDESLITLGKYSNADVNNNNGTWQAGGASIDTINNILAATGVSSFSSYTGAQLEMYDAIEPLPVNLLYFNAQPTGEEVELTWATAREENNDLFTIERSADGKNYSQVLQKDGSGNSNKRIDYKAYDRNPIKGLSYYRLKQTDFDGSFSYSAVVAVNFNGNKTTELVAYPNPSTGKSVGLIIKGLNGQKAIVKITDLVGKTLYSQKVDILENNQEIIIDFATKLTPGSYTITITGNRNLLTTKLIVN